MKCENFKCLIKFVNVDFRLDMYFLYIKFKLSE